MSSLINYSKFEKLEVSSSDEESRNRKPQITTLNNNDKVMIGPNGLTILKNADEKKTNEINKNIQCLEGEEVDDKNKEILKKENINNKDIMKNETIFKNMVINGGVIPFKCIWNQSIHYINGYISLPLHSKAKYLVVEIYEDKLIVKKKKLSNTLNDESKKKNDLNNYDILIDKYFYFKINMNEDTQLWEIKNMKINWHEIFYLSNKINNQTVEFNFGENTVEKEETFLYISLKKKSEIENSYIWWRSLFKDGEKINISNLPARISINKNNNNISFKNVWDEAHKIFKKKISEKNPYPIDS
ncbi:conserved Plasmodium protein, unknown function [Plasmodium gallinaceum]|uniref:CS domain-containing protein n=1 Tax=Plasmodium gallinaceum TaxID=5849 RepID=A0A1J1GQW4_PLAGA|nr:conserved Plasmodium protein, unknown function [Plasmodium gallinaceum]CRG94682.1 conserved Plasmodium protein, unknown function [Plasmodium gallinaceum]